MLSILITYLSGVHYGFNLFSLMSECNFMRIKIKRIQAYLNVISKLLIFLMFVNYLTIEYNYTK